MRNVPLYIIMCLILRLFYIIVVIQRVIELLRSLLIITMLVTTWLTSWTLTTTLMTVITTTATLTTLWTWTTLTLYITLWLLHQHTVRELVLASLRINLHQLHLDLVAFLDTSFLNCLKTLPVNLRDVEQTILTWQNLYEATVRHDRANGTLINLTYLRNSYDSLDLSQSSIDRILVRSRYLYVTLTLSLIHI